MYLLLRERFPRYRRYNLRPFALVCNNLCNSVAKRIIRSACLAATLSVPLTAHAQAVKPDETCTTVRKVFFGMDDIAKKGNTTIIPFSKEYRSVLASYFERGCPVTESFPLPKQI